MHRLLFIFLLSIICPLVSAQLPLVRNITTLESHSGTQNWAIDQGNDARMYFANNQGLLVFDGGQWKILPTSNNTVARSVYFDSSNNRLYMGCSDDFGYYVGNHYTSLSATLTPNQRPKGEIWNILPMRQGIVFISKDCLYLYQPNGKICSFSIPYRAFRAGKIGNDVLIPTQQAVYRFDGNRLQRLSGFEALKDKPCCAVLPLGRNMLFVTETDGLYLYDGHQLTPYEMDISPFLKQARVYCAATKGDVMAFGTVKNGLVVKRLGAASGAIYANSMSGLLNNTILSLKIDMDNNVWLGLDNGIAYVELNSPFLNLLGINNNVGTGYVAQVMGSQLYLGTNQGLFVMPTAQALYANPSLPSVKPTTVQGLTGQIWNLRLIGNTLLCAADMGTFSVHGEQAVKVNGLIGTWDFVPLPNHPGYALSCDYNGFFILKVADGTATLSHRLKDMPGLSTMFLVDNDASVWVSYWREGVRHFRLSSDLKHVTHSEYFRKGHELPMNDVNNICQIRGKVYISTVEGFKRYNAHTHRLESVAWLDRLFPPTSESYRIQEMPNGNLWVFNQGYVALAHPDGKGYRVQHISNGNLTNRLQNSFGHVSMLDEHHSLLNYDNGFFVTNDQYVAHPIAKKLFVRSLWSIVGQHDSLLYMYTGASHPSQTITVPHALRSVRIEFVLPEYSNENAVEYQCMLEGYAHEWSQPQTATYKEYTQLHSGTYTFRVKAHNLCTGQNTETSIQIRVLPAWYETWWAITLYILLTIAAIRGIVKWLQYRTERKMRRIQRRKERQLKEQRARLQIEKAEKEKEVAELRSQQLETELKHKASELASSTTNLIRKNDLLQGLDEHMEAISRSVKAQESAAKITKIVNDARHDIKMSRTEDDNWDTFAENFNIVYDNYIQKLVARFPLLKKNDLKLCAYLKMGLSSKEMASLLNTSTRSIETARYRLRKKLDLDSGASLTHFLQQIDMQTDDEEGNKNQ